MVDTVVINSTPPVEDPNHVQNMIDVVDKANAVSGVNTDPSTDNKTENRPEWLPEKFNSPEDLAKAYNELQQKLGGKQTEEAPKEETPPSGDDLNKQVDEELQSKGLDLQTFSDEFFKSGSLSQESYDALEKAGYPRNYVDQFIEGQRARASLYESEVKSAVGGNNNFNEMVDWAKANLSVEEINAYNRAIDSGDMNQAKLAAAGMYQKFSASRPSEPNLFKGTTNAGQSSDVYESIAQMQKDMANPDYKKDPAFRARVERKLARSNIL
jgi:hypothetical protein